VPKSKEVYAGRLKMANHRGYEVACVKNLIIDKIYSGEIEMWKKLEHQNIVDFYGACCCWELGDVDLPLFLPDYTVTFVMERMDTTLEEYMKRPTKPEKKLIVSILYQVTRPIKYLSDQGIENQYIKTFNYLVNEIQGGDIILKLGYFGLTRKQDLSEKNDNTLNRTKEVVYSLGCILKELLSWGGLELEEWFMYKLDQMTDRDPEKRPDISEILVYLESWLEWNVWKSEVRKVARSDEKTNGDTV
jgi:hypothetical protein